MAGLLHDLGKVVTAVQLHRTSRPGWRPWSRPGHLPTWRPRGRDGFRHDRVNAWIADHWKLPPASKEGISYHLAPARQRLYPEAACCVHLGDFMVRCSRSTARAATTTSPYLEAGAQEAELKPSDLEAILDRLSVGLLDLSFVWQPLPGSTHRIAQSMTAKLATCRLRGLPALRGQRLKGNAGLALGRGPDGDRPFRPGPEGPSRCSSAELPDLLIVRPAGHARPGRGQPGQSGENTSAAAARDPGHQEEDLLAGSRLVRAAEVDDLIVVPSTRPGSRRASS